MHQSTNLKSILINIKIKDNENDGIRTKLTEREVMEIKQYIRQGIGEMFTMYTISFDFDKQNYQAMQDIKINLNEDESQLTYNATLDINKNDNNMYYNLGHEYSLINNNMYR